jgi:holo-[acyl-carrier protein] synthase
MSYRAILGVGVDMCKIARIQRIITKNDYHYNRFLTGVYHPTEVEEFKAKQDDTVKLQYLASRFALKEALVKASGRPDLQYTGIYLLKGGGRPVLTVDGEKNTAIFKELNVCGVHSSISHEEEYAVAFVTLECLVN